MRPLFPSLLLCALIPCSAGAQEWSPNYDEDAIPEYELPDPLVCLDGTEVKSAEGWTRQRRPEVLALFEEHMYGRAPAPPEFTYLRGEEVSDLGGRATRREVVLRCATERGAVAMTLLLWCPAESEGPAPAFLGLNFWGNHTVSEDPAIAMPGGWVPNRGPVRDHKATPESRGARTSRWPVEAVIERGYALATMYYGDIEPDHERGFAAGVRALHGDEEGRAPGDWGSIAAWAWGLSRALDYLETDARVDAQRVAVVGHSRLGKTALWAGAVDPRFALVISNDSGCGGAALSRRRIGETVWRINDSFPHWFCAHFKQYADHEEALPFDQHMLVALMAPRPVLICSATEDRWADPRGEFLSAYHAAPVFELLGAGGLDADEMPEPDRLVKSRVGYFLRTGKHDMTVEDWAAFLEFADHHGL